MPRVQAQEVIDEQWSDPINLSAGEPSGGVNDDLWPALATDQMGNVHVVWVETDEAKSERLDGPALIYSMRKNGEWTQPIDIIIEPPGYFHLPSLAVDELGQIHVIWHNWRRLFQSFASAQLKPWSAFSWSQPLELLNEDTNPYWSDIVAQGPTLYVVWESNDIYFQRSDDYGETWSEPVVIAQTDLPSHRASLTIDNQDTLHVTWDDATADDSGMIIWYARSGDHGKSWTAPIQLYSRPTDASTQEAAWWAAIAAADSTLVVTWMQPNALVSTHSLDGGITWANPTTFHSMERSGWGYFDLAVDSQGNVYGVGSEAGRIIWSLWRGAAAGWTSVQTVAGNQGSRLGERVRAAIANGNELHAVWMSERDKGSIDVFHSSMKLPSPASGPTAFATKTIDNTASSLPTPLQSRKAEPLQVPTVSRVFVVQVDHTLSVLNSPTLSIYVAGAVSVGFSLLAVGLFGLGRRRRP